MMKNIFYKYKNLVDEKIGNGTLLVFIIALLIILIGYFISNDSQNYKSNVLESHQLNQDSISFINKSTITIDNKVYKLTFTEVQ